MMNYFLPVIIIGVFYGCINNNNDNVGEVKNLPVNVVQHKLDKDLVEIKLPAGFNINYYAENVKGARSMALGADGVVFVGTRGSKVYALKDKNQDGIADSVYTIATGLNSPNGVAFKDGNLYVAEIDRVLRYDNIGFNLNNPPKPVVINDKFPKDGHHGWKYIGFGPDGKLYIPVGAPCNICELDYNKYGNLMRMNVDGTGLELFAKGIRNTVGFDWHPENGVLWFTDNGRDMLGDDIPSDELNKAASAGLHFGFPYCHQGDIRDPKFDKYDCNNFVRPELNLGAHVAALGMKFYNANQFPDKYKNAIFIAEHGSWNRSSKVGYRIVAVLLEGSKIKNHEVFAEGWLQNENAWGRPVDVLVLPDGSMLISDDHKGAIYRITYSGK